MNMIGAGLMPHSSGLMPESVPYLSCQPEAELTFADCLQSVSTGIADYADIPDLTLVSVESEIVDADVLAFIECPDAVNVPSLPLDFKEHEKAVEESGILEYGVLQKAVNESEFMYISTETEAVELELQKEAPQFQVAEPQQQEVSNGLTQSYEQLSTTGTAEDEVSLLSSLTKGGEQLVGQSGIDFSEVLAGEQGVILNTEKYNEPKNVVQMNSAQTQGGEQPQETATVLSKEVSVEMQKANSQEASKQAKSESKSESSGLPKFFEGLEKEIVKDITDFKASNLTKEEASSQAKDGVQENNEANNAKSQLNQLKEMAESHQKPVIKEGSENTKELVEGSKSKEGNESSKEQAQNQTDFVSVSKAVNASQGAKQSMTVANQVSTAMIEKITELKVMVEKTQTTQMQEFKITLNPEHLGKVTVQLTTDGTKLSVLIFTANNEVRDLLMARMQSVRVMVELTGVTIERYEVVTQGQNHGMVNSMSEAQQDIYDRQSDKENGSNGHDEQDGETDEEDVQMSFADLIQEMGV